MSCLSPVGLGGVIELIDDIEDEDPILPMLPVDVGGDVRPREVAEVDDTIEIWPEEPEVEMADEYGMSHDSAISVTASISREQTRPASRATMRTASTACFATVTSVG